MLKIFGKNPSGSLLQKIKHSPNYKSKAFQNLLPTPMILKGISSFDLLRKFLNKPSDTKPPKRLPSEKHNLKNLDGDSPTIIWFGHSSYFIRINQKNILIDPVFSGNASPLPFMIKAFNGSDIYDVDDFPQIDYLIITHDHYDHLDYRTIKKLKPKVTSVYCPLGVSSHLALWGFEVNIINELDWWQSKMTGDDIELTAAPARHFSGRSFDRCKTLWTSFSLKTKTYKLYLGGDSGYGEHFKKVGKDFGPFDIAILEAGQYNAAWPLIHMMPEQTVQAAIDLRADALMPVHWGKFSLALHPWREPIERVLKEAAIKQMKVTTPMIGEPVILHQSYPSKEWWNF